MKKIICILCAMLTTGMMMVSPCMAKDNFADFSLSNERNIVPHNLIITDSTVKLNRLTNSVNGSVYMTY